MPAPVRGDRHHDALLDALTAEAVPTLRAAFGMGVDVAAEMLIVVGDNPERIRSEAAVAKLCGACPIPASSGATHRHRLFHGGHRHANAALHRVALVRRRWHEPTKKYAERRTGEGLSKRDVLRCLKRFVAPRSTARCWATTAPASPRRCPPQHSPPNAPRRLLTHRGVNTRQYNLQTAATPGALCV